ncbi:MAG TPA: pectate lyase, partial [Sphingobacteriaceae bacterium]
YFDGIKGAPIATIGTVYGFVGGEKTNIFNNCAPNKIRTSASTWKPTYSYQSALIAAANVPAAVKAGAGAQ